MKRNFGNGLFLSLCLVVAGCQVPAVKLDTLDAVARATLIDSAIGWDAPGQEIDAGGGDESTLTIAGATVLAMKHNPELAAALWRVRIAQADASQERMLPNPVIALTMRLPEAGGKPALEASLAEDLLSLLRRGRKISAADDKLRAASAAVLTQAITVVAEAQEQYLATAIVDDELAVLAGRRRLLDRTLTVARDRLKAGEGTRLDVTTLEAQRVELEAEAADREAERTQQRITLARVIGRPLGRIDWKLEPATLPAVVRATERQWIEAALTNRPELEAKRWDLAALGEEVALANWAIWEPTDIGVMAQRDPDWQVGPSISAPLPIFDNGRAKRDKATAGKMEAVHQLVAARRQIVEEVRKAYAASAAAVAAVDKVGSELLPLQVKRRDQAESAYRVGESDLTPLLLAEDGLATSRAKLIELREKAAVAQVKLERAVGGRGAAVRVATSQPATQPAGAGAPNRSNP